MKRYPHRLLLSFSLAALLGSFFLVTGGCAKNRLLTKVDSIPEVPAQFHYFNAFGYDSALNLSVDGLLRETVKSYAFSSYYPSSSAFNLNEAQPNSKLLTTSDPTNASLFLSTATIQFQPLTSYLVYPQYGSYDTIYTPEKTIVPTLLYYPEDINHPFDGSSRIRFLDMTASVGVNGLTVTPNAGAGTSLSLYNIYIPLGANGQPASAAITYQSTQPGAKVVTMQFSANQITVQVTYQPVQLSSGTNYTLMAVGDPRNYLEGIQPMPKLFLVADGDPKSLQALTVASIGYPGNNNGNAVVTALNAAYNIPGFIAFGVPMVNYVAYPYLNIAFNQTNVELLRWPLTPSDPQVEDIGDEFDPASPYPSQLLGNPARVATTSLAPGIYTATLTPNGTFSPQYDRFTYSFQAGLAYTVCLVPNDSSATQCGTLVLQNDASPNPQLFKLRIINLMGGAPQLDVHLNSPNGPLLASAVPFDQATDYITLNSTSTNQNLYVTAVGTTTPLFPQDGTVAGKLISVPFTAGNSATIYLTGLLPGTPYSGNSGYFGPYSLYLTDAYVSPYNKYNGGNPVQIYY